MNKLILSLLILAACGQSRATTYATWIMIWYGHDQAWWRTENPDATKNLLNGKWTTLDWADDSQIGAHLDGIKKAGVTVVIVDLTNGWGWLDGRCQLIQKACAERGMKFCVAENSGGNTAQFESHAKDIWDRFAGPDAPSHQTYFHYRGKPLIVCYAIRDWYRAYLKSDTPFRSSFSLVWASGEDSCINKWGWQLEPWIGSVPSTDSMYVTPAVRWDPSKGDMWRKSIAWLDYNFALAKKNDPAYIIIGSYDDPTERNSWLVSDTAQCEPGRQIRDKTGALNPSALYDRVREWTSGKPSVVPGGLIEDGAYQAVNRKGKRLGVKGGEPGAELGESADGMFWFYHLGGNRYRIIALPGCLALQSDGDKIIQTWDSPDPNQRWAVTRAKDGFLRLRNGSTSQTLECRLKPTLVPKEE